MSFLSNAINTMRTLARAANGCEGMSAWRHRPFSFTLQRGRPPPFDRKRFLSTRLKS